MVWVWVEQLIQDVRYALRTLRANRMFAGVVVATLAVAIGMNTAIFSVFNAVVLRPLGYPDADRLVWVATVDGDDDRGFVTGPDFTDWRAQATSFERMARVRRSPRSATGRPARFPRAFAIHASWS